MEVITFSYDHSKLYQVAVAELAELITQHAPSWRAVGYSKPDPSGLIVLEKGVQSGAIFRREAILKLHRGEQVAIVHGDLQVTPMHAAS